MDAGARWRYPNSSRVLRQCRPRRLQLAGAGRCRAVLQACRLNRTIPCLDPPQHLLLWQRLEGAKHRMVYGLLRLGLPLVSRAEDPAGLAFDFSPIRGGLAGQPQTMTGHAEGLITINSPKPTTPSASAAGRTWRSPIARCSDTSVTRSATTTGKGWCAGSVARAVPGAVRRRERGLRRQPRAAPRQRAAGGLAGALRQRLRQRPSLGGLGGDLCPLSPRGRHARDRARLQSAPAPRSRRDPALAMAADFDPYGMPTSMR